MEFLDNILYFFFGGVFFGAVEDFLAGGIAVEDFLTVTLVTNFFSGAVVV